jgi:hypothetical protein
MLQFIGRFFVAIFFIATWAGIWVGLEKLFNIFFQTNEGDLLSCVAGLLSCVVYVILIRLACHTPLVKPFNRLGKLLYD